YASREAIFVTCEGASLLPVQVARLSEALLPPAPAGPAPLSDMLGAGERAAVPAEEVESAQAQPAAGGAVLLLGEPEPAAGGQPVTVRRPSLLKDQGTVDVQTQRLRQVCRTLFRDRQPYCPVNGILVLVPLAATATAEDASETAAVVRHD